MNQPFLTDQQLNAIKKYFATQEDVVAAYLYGSFATGNTHQGSDIDIGVLFKKPITTFEVVSRIHSDLCDLDLPGEPEVRNIDLNQTPVFLRSVIQGKLIFSKDEIKRIRFEVNVMRIFRDTEYYRNLRYFYLSQRIKEDKYGFGPQYTP